MSYLFLYLDQLRNLGALIVAELLLVWANIPPRRNVRARLTVSFLALLLLASLYLGLYRYFYAYIGFIAIAWYFAVNLLAGAMIAFCFEIKYSSLIWVMLSAYAIQHCVYVIVNEMIFQGVLSGVGGWWLELLCYCALCAAVYVLFHRIFRENIRYLDRFYLNESRGERVLVTLSSSSPPISINSTP